MYSRIFCLAALACLPGRSQVHILTANGDNTRANANLSESRLSPATLSSSNFGKLGILPVDGQIYAQPLYVSGLSIPGKGTHNVLFVATLHNSVYAFDADATSPVNLLWKVNLGAPVPASLLFGQYGDVYLEVGILSTGAIDLKRGVLYVVTDVLVRGAPVFSLHALDLATGEERLNGPVTLAASVEGTGSASVKGKLAFDPMQHIQRPGLLLANNAVYVAFGSHGDDSPWHGWVMSYDAGDLTHQFGVYNSTPDADGGSFWQSGRGLAADEQGAIYTMTGNGDYDGVRNFSQSFLKLTGAAPALASSYTPADWKSMSDYDFDLSAGPALINGSHTVVGGDKFGNVYVLNFDALSDSSAQVIMRISQDSIFNLAVWSRPGNALVYVQSGKDPLRCFQVASGTLDANPVSVASTTVDRARIGMTLSANGAREGTGILWETTGDYNVANVPGTLHAYDASNLANEIWNSDQSGSRDTMLPVAKFVSPTVANGKVYVPTFGNAVVVYGWIGGDDPGPILPAITAVGNAASYSHDAVSPGELVAIFGSNLGPSTPAGMELDVYGQVGNNLGGTQVLFDGVPGPMVFASADQVNAIVPFRLDSAATQVQVVAQGQASDPFPMSVASSTPGVFSADGSGSGQGIILNQDNSINSEANPAAPGSVVTLWATGAGQFSPPGIDGSVITADSLPAPVLPVTVQVGGQTAQVLYAGGAPAMVTGVIQVNLQIPDGVSGPAEVVLRIGNQASQPGLTVAIRP